MTTREMHYDFKQKFNKGDSQKNKGFLVPEIDWFLNEAVELFVKKIAQPKVNVGLGFEMSQRMIEDIKTIVVGGTWLPVVNNVITLPANYNYFVRCRVKMSKGSCKGKEGVLSIEAHNNLFEESQFYKSSFEWREVNGVYESQGIQAFTDGTFTIDEAKLSYIRKMNYIHNAQDFGSGAYLHPSGVTLTGTVNCDLPEHTHREIVDIAVMLAASGVQTSDLQSKMSKLNFNQIV
jgi:hypothetical protein